VAKIILSECIICNAKENLALCSCGSGPYCVNHLEFHKHTFCGKKSKKNDDTYK
jgi:hypothetical protein